MHKLRILYYWSREQDKVVKAFTMNENNAHPLVLHECTYPLFEDMCVRAYVSRTRKVSALVKNTRQLHAPQDRHTDRQTDARSYAFVVHCFGKRDRP